MKKYSVGVIGATGMVGQRFLLLLANHPWFEVKCLAASASSAGKKYRDAIKRWHMSAPLPEKFADTVVMDASADKEKIASSVDFCFCAVNMAKNEIRELEYAYARLECPIISNNSAHRFTDDVPMIIPEVNPEHSEVIAAQKKRLGKARFYRRKKQLLFAVVRAAFAPLEKIRNKVRGGMHLSGDFGRGQNL